MTVHRIPFLNSIRWLGLWACALVPLTSFAQDGLTIDSITVAWPRVDVHFSAECGGYPAGFHVDVLDSYITVTEAGKNVDSFTISCPDTSYYEATVSAVLAIDRTGSMNMFNKMDIMRAFANAFVDSLDVAGGEECAILSFSTTTTLNQQMTQDKTALKDAIAALVPAGNTAVWDACIYSINECINFGKNPAREIVLVSDGGDNSSVNDFPAVVNYALARNVRIHCIGIRIPVGTVQDQLLEYLASVTNAAYYRLDSLSDAAAIAGQILNGHVIVPGGCTLSYESECANGAMRILEMEVRDLCFAGKDSMSFRAPRDETTYDKIFFDINEAASVNGGSIELQISATMGPPGSRNVGPIQMEVHFNSSALAFDSIRTVNTFWEGAPVLARITSPGVLDLYMLAPADMHSDVLCNLVFTPLMSDTTLVDSILITNIEIQQHCDLGLMRTAGVYRLLPDPQIEYVGSLVRCEGDSVLLSATDGFAGYKWNTGDASRSLMVYATGDYYIDCYPLIGQPPIRKYVSVQFLPVPVAPPLLGPDTVCAFSSTLYEFNGPAGIVYTWEVLGGGFTTLAEDLIRVHWGKGDSALVRLIASNGACADTSELSVTIPPHPEPTVVPAGPVYICQGDTLTLDGPMGFTKYQWSNGRTTRSINVTRSGIYYVKLTAPSGCPDTSNFVEVIVNPSPPKPVISFADDVLTSTAATGYQWYLNGVPISGATGQSYKAIETGVYTVVITDAAGCDAESEEYTVSVLGLPGLAENANVLELYPDPNSGVFTISLLQPTPSGMDIRVTDNLGRVVFEGMYEGHVSAPRAIRLPDVVPGVYFLTARTADRMYSRKFIVR